MTTLTLRKGQTQQFKAIILPDTHPDKSVVWGVGDNTIVSCSSTGLVTALAGGTTTIYTESLDMCSGTKRAYYQVIVEEPVTGVTMNCSPNEVEVGKTIQLIAEIQPPNAANRQVLWMSSDTTIATVMSDGTVTGVAPGTAIIGVQTIEGGFIAYCTITVKEAAPPLPRVYLGAAVGSRFKVPNHTCIWIDDEYTITFLIGTEPNAPTEPVVIDTWSVSVAIGEGTVVQTLNTQKISDTAFSITVKGLAVGTYNVAAQVTVTPTHVTRNVRASTGFPLYVYSKGTPDPPTWDPTCTHDRNRAPYNPNCLTLCHLAKPPF